MHFFSSNFLAWLKLGTGQYIVFADEWIGFNFIAVFYEGSG